MHKDGWEALLDYHSVPLSVGIFTRRFLLIIARFLTELALDQLKLIFDARINQKHAQGWLGSSF